MKTKAPDAEAIHVDLTQAALAIPIGQIVTRADQPRQSIGEPELAELAADIRRRGKVLQPLRVREKDGRYEIIAGERRYRAAVEAGLTHVPVVVETEPLDDEAAYEDAVAENVHREDLSAVELAEALRRIAVARGFLADGVDAELARQAPDSLRVRDLDAALLAEQVSMAVRRVERHLRLLGAPTRLLDALRRNRVPYGTAERLVAVARKGGPEGLTRAVAAARRATVTQRRAESVAKPKEARGVRPYFQARTGEIRLRALRVRLEAPQEDKEAALEAAKAFVAALEAQLST